MPLGPTTTPPNGIGVFCHSRTRAPDEFVGSCPPTRPPSVCSRGPSRRRDAKPRAWAAGCGSEGQCSSTAFQADDEGSIPFTRSTKLAPPIGHIPSFVQNNSVLDQDGIG